MKIEKLKIKGSVKNWTSNDWIDFISEFNDMNIQDADLKDKVLFDMKIVLRDILIKEIDSVFIKD